LARGYKKPFLEAKVILMGFEVNSTYEGSRQMYIMDIGNILG